MKYGVVFFITLLFSSEIISQNTINGSVIDSKKVGIEMAVVTVLNAENGHIIKNIITDSNGNFTFETKNTKILFLISSLGYKDIKSSVFSITKNTNLPSITLTEDVISLNEMVIVGEKPILQVKDGKIIYNVQKSNFAKGTNSLDLLKKAPGIFVNQDGTISINGKQDASVMINNKSTHLSKENIIELLKSTSSENIASIEIVNNPSAEYDASGSGGIVNIVLKKKFLQGFSSSITSGISYWKHLRNHTSFSLNYNKNKWIIFSSYHHQIGNYDYTYGTKRIQNEKKYHSHTKDTDKRKAINGTFGFDYLVNKHHTLGMVINGNFHFGPGITNTKTTVREEESALLQSTLLAKNDYYAQKKNRYGVNVNYRIAIPNKYRLNFDVDYISFKGNSKNYQPNTYYNATNQKIAENIYRSINFQDIDIAAFSANYQTSVWNGTLKTGIKSSVVNSNNRFHFYTITNTEEVIDVNKSNHFDYQEIINSGYVQYNKLLSKKYKLNIGVRFENSDPKGVLTPIEGSSQQKQTNGESYFNTFPSVSLTSFLKEQNSITLSYAKRIDRPAYNSLNPFEYLLDEFYYWKGNPFLRPQITHRISFQYQIKNTILELSGSQTYDFNKQISKSVPPNKIVMTPENIGKKQYLGFSSSQRFLPNKKWKLSLNTAVFYVTNDFNSESEQNFDVKKVENIHKFAGNISIHSSYKLPWNIWGETSVNYYTKRFGSANDVLESGSQIDFSFSKKINDHWQIHLAFTDVFLGSNWNSTGYFKDFELYTYGHGESRQFKMSATYSFKNRNSKTLKNRQSNISSETNRL